MLLSTVYDHVYSISHNIYFLFNLINYIFNMEILNDVEAACVIFTPREEYKW
jgi:hypothetical protein